MTEPKLSRRLIAIKVTAAAAVLTGCVAPSSSYAPTYRAPARRANPTDADPSDGPGQGRGSSYRPSSNRGATDADPSDGPGQGRGNRRY